MLQVTPTGPWGTDVHPNMPVALDDLLIDLRECFWIGATGVHLHVRDDFGAETLEPAVVNERCRQVRDLAADVGVSAEIGLTTGEWIVPDVARRTAMIREWEGINDALDSAGSTCPRLTHGMNDWTWPLVADAFRRGHDTRVGFEDSVYLPDGTKAQSNADLVQAAMAIHASIAQDRRPKGGVDDDRD